MKIWGDIIKNRYKKSIYRAETICRKHGYHIIEGTYKSKYEFDIIDKLGYKYSNCSIYTLDHKSNKNKKFSDKNNYKNHNIKLYKYYKNIQ